MESALVICMDGICGVYRQWMLLRKNDVNVMSES